MGKGSRTALIIGGLVLALIIILPLALGIITRFRFVNWGWGLMGPGMMYGFGGGWFMGIVMILFWGLIIGVIIGLVRYFGGVSHNDSHGNSALELLKMRYAQGEIGKEEYEEKRKSLS